MAKFKRITVGSVCKSKEEDKPDYFKVRGDTREVLANAILKMDPEKGGSLKLESKKFQLLSLAKAVDEGKISPENAKKAEERINKIPDYVRAEAIWLQPEN